MTYNEPPIKWMPQFYGCLAEEDISILCFDAYLHYQDITQLYPNKDLSENHLRSTTGGIYTNFELGVPITKYNLPSWTGVFGEHIPAIGFKKPIHAEDVLIKERCIHIKSTSIPISIKNKPGSSKIKQQKRPSFHSRFTYPLAPTWLQGVIRYLFIDSSKKPILFIATETEETTSTHNTFIGEYQIKATHILPVEREDEYWTSNVLPSSSSSQVIGGFLSLTENCTDCEILGDIQFEICEDSIAMPVVVKKNEEYYKSIGICVLALPYELSDPSIVQGKREFKIL